MKNKTIKNLLVKLNNYRMLLAFSIKEFCALFGINASTYNRWMNGSQTPDDLNLYKINWFIYLYEHANTKMLTVFISSGLFKNLEWTDSPSLNASGLVHNLHSEPWLYNADDEGYDEDPFKGPESDFKPDHIEGLEDLDYLDQMTIQDALTRATEITAAYTIKTRELLKTLALNVIEAKDLAKDVYDLSGLKDFIEAIQVMSLKDERFSTSNMAMNLYTFRSGDKMIIPPKKEEIDALYPEYYNFIGIDFKEDYMSGLDGDDTKVVRFVDSDDNGKFSFIIILDNGDSYIMEFIIKEELFTRYSNVD